MGHDMDRYSTSSWRSAGSGFYLLPLCSGWVLDVDRFVGPWSSQVSCALEVRGVASAMLVLFQLHWALQGHDADPLEFGLCGVFLGFNVQCDQCTHVLWRADYLSSDRRGRSWSSGNFSPLLA